MIHVEFFNHVHARVICDDSIAQELSDYFSFMVPNYRFMPSYRNKVWDGKIRLFNIRTRNIYLGLKSQIEHFCKERGYEYSEDEVFHSDSFSLHEAREWIDSNKFKLTPRDYQIEAFAKAVRYRRMLFLSPTASGKSFIIYLITKYLQKKTLIIVPTVSLVQQMAGDFIDYDPTIGEDIHKISSGADKTPVFYYFTCENGIQYKFEGNQSIKLINNKEQYKFAKDININDEIDDRWLQKYH